MKSKLITLAALTMAACATPPAPTAPTAPGLGNYRAVVIESVRIAPEAALAGSTDRVALERQMHVALVDAIPTAQRAAGPGADVLRVRITVTAIEAVDPVKNGVSTTLIGMPIDRGSIAFEARYYEPGAAEPFATLQEHHKAGRFAFGGSMSHYGHAVGALRDWGTSLAGSLART